MASKTRPVSLIHPSSPSPPSFSVDHLSPLRQSLSSSGAGHYSLRRFSYIPDLSEHAPARSCSILRSASLSSMGFRIRERAKEEAGHVQSESPAARLNERSPSSQSLFSRHMPRGLKKAVSLTPHGTPLPFSEAPPSSTRAQAPDSRISLPTPALEPSSSSVHKGKAEQVAEQRLRKDESRQLPLKPVRPSAHTKETVWAKRHNMKTHTLHNKAAYMQAYDPILLDNDRHFDLLLRRLNTLESPSFHDYGQTVPSRVLDLGCGSGHWLLEASRCWSQSLITGLDIVDILIPEVQNNDHIEFVQTNFLKTPWPLPDKTFDLVRMANLSLCMPYDKWETVLAQVHRVLTLGGRLELIDDQIFFPYAPQVMSQLPALEIAEPKSAILMRGASFFGNDNNDDDTDSVETESTLTSEGDTSFVTQRSEQQSSTTSADAEYSSVDDVINPKANNPSTLSTTAKNKVADISSSHYWNLDAAASRDLETVFQNMLHQKYRIHSRPSEFVLNVMQHVFGNGEKLKSFHLKLAPGDAHVEFGTSSSDHVNRSGHTEGSDKEEKPFIEPRKTSLKGFKKTWFSGDLEEKFSKKLSKSSSIETQHSLDSQLSDAHSAKVASHLSDIPQVISRIPENVSAKAAHRLGLPMSSDSNGEGLSEPRPAISRSRSMKLLTMFTPSATPIPSPILPAAPTPLPPTPLPEKTDQDSQLGHTAESRLSAKAAHRLGISYSALSEAAAIMKASRRPLSSSSTLVSYPLATIQSPGLIVWPSKFIPLSPSELEMHACKNMHTLLGCKPALAEYIDSFRDEEGNRIENEESFEQALWDYECFRRRRFHWPSEIPEWDTDLETDAPEAVSTPKPVDDPKFNQSTIPDAPYTAPALPLPLHKPHDLLHVRTLRVYEAIKTDDYSLSTLQFPRSPPPSPPY